MKFKNRLAGNQLGFLSLNSGFLVAATSVFALSLGGAVYAEQIEAEIPVGSDVSDTNGICVTAIWEDSEIVSKIGDCPAEVVDSVLIEDENLDLADDENTGQDSTKTTPSDSDNSDVSTPKDDDSTRSENSDQIPEQIEPSIESPVFVQNPDYNIPEAVPTPTEVIGGPEVVAPVEKEVEKSAPESNLPIYVRDNEAIMITTWSPNIAPNCKNISLPINGVGKETTVNWGDGKGFVNYKKSNDSYDSSQTAVTITIKGSFNGWGTPRWEDANCLISVDRWGDTGTKNLSSAFHNADNLKYVHAIPISAKNMTKAFLDVDSDFKLGYFDTSNVNSMSQMFNNATKFNQDLSYWDVKNSFNDSNFSRGADSWILPKPNFK